MTTPSLPELPKKRRAFHCLKCGSTECVAGHEEEHHPACAKCHYLGFASDCAYNDDEMRAYALSALAADRAATAPDERAAFEAWAIGQGARRDHLMHDRWHWAWRAWQQALAPSVPPVGVGREAEHGSVDSVESSSLPAAALWQPIGSAPKDGTAIVLGAKAGIWIGKYQPVYQSGYRPENPWSSLMLNHDHMGEKWWKPTHWMPLPEAPKDQQ